MIQEQADISVVLVNYKTPALLLACIESIYAESLSLNVEIIVVDNDSQDGSEQQIKSRFEKVLWLSAGYNSGFARANNLGLQHATAAYTLILNSDTVIKERAIEKALAFYKLKEKSTQLGFVGCKLVQFDGNVQHPSHTRLDHWGKLLLSNAFYKVLEKLFDKQRHNKRQQQAYARKQQEHTVQHESRWLAGAFWLFRTNICATKATQLDEDFFMYSEDEELCLRLGRIGYKHIYYSEAYILHADGGSSTIKETRQNQITLSEWLFIMKIYGKAAYMVFVFITALNLFCDELFYRQAYWRGRLTEGDLTERTLRSWRWNMVKRYFTVILFNYHRRTSSAKNFLKYGG